MSTSQRRLPVVQPFASNFSSTIKSAANASNTSLTRTSSTPAGTLVVRELQRLAYVIFGDKTLRQMALEYPARESAIQGFIGMGEKKREEFAATFAGFIADFLETNPRQSFND